MHVAPYTVEAGIAAEIAILVRVGVEIEQLWREALPVDVFPAVGANHPRPALVRFAAEYPARLAVAVIELGENAVAPLGNVSSARQRQQRAAFDALGSAR